MRIFLAIITGLLGGFFIGIALSSMIGTISYSIFGEPYGIKFLPYYAALICAVLVPLAERKRSRYNHSRHQ